MDEAVLTIDHLNRRFGSTLANDDVSLHVKPGEVVGLLGHNGAGKTTLVSQIVGLVRPGAGQIRVGQVDAVSSPAAARRHVALQPQAQAPIDGLTPRMAIEISARIRGASVREARRAAAELAEELDIGPWLDTKAQSEGAGLSGGVRRLTAFAMALAKPTPLLIFDEPTNDVDASRRRLLWDAVRRRGDRGCGVLLVTHNVAEAERVVDRLVVLDQGRALASGTPAQLRGTGADHQRLELQLPPSGTSDLDIPQTLDLQNRVAIGARLRMTVPEADVAAAVSWASEEYAARRIEGYSLSPVTLEDTYLRLTSDAGLTSTGNERLQEAHHG